MLIFLYFNDCTDHSAYTTINELGGRRYIRGLTLYVTNASKIEQIVKYRQASFPLSGLSTF